MENIIEKCVVRQKQQADKIIKIITIPVAGILCIIPLFISGIRAYTPVVALIVIYVAFKIVVSRNIEFEYELVENSITISKIINKSSRKKIFNSALTDFDIIAPITSKHYEPFADNVQHSIEAVSTMSEDNIYFGIIQYKKKRTCVMMECDKKMLNHIKKQVEYKLKS